MDDFKPRQNKGDGRFANRSQFDPAGKRSQPAAFSPPKPPRREEPKVYEKAAPKPAKANRPKVKKSKNRSKKPRKLIMAVLLLGILGAGGWLGYKQFFAIKPAAKQQSSQSKPAAQKLSGNFRVVATGDMITHDSVNQNAKKPDGSYDYSPMLSELRPLLEKSQTRICHNTVPAGGPVIGISGFPSFNAPSELVTGLAKSGCNVMSLASDHINDKGQPAIDATLQEVDKNKSIVVTAGANRSADEQKKERYFNVADGVVKFAYFSYTTRQHNPTATPFGVDTYSKEKAARQIAAVRKTADIVFVSMCWGKEDSADVITEQDLYAQELADAGADVIFGHCTHVVQPVKNFKSASGRETIVYYSLGNMLSSQLPLDTLIGGLAVIDIDLGSKKITSAGILPTYMHYEWTPEQKQKKDYNSRRNLKLYPLDKAEAQLAASGHGTTVQAQMERINEVTNRFTAVKILKSSDF